VFLNERRENAEKERGGWISISTGREDWNAFAFRFSHTKKGKEERKQPHLALVRCYATSETRFLDSLRVFGVPHKEFIFEGLELRKDLLIS